jgi:translation initiation factor IF-2
MMKSLTIEYEKQRYFPVFVINQCLMYKKSFYFIVFVLQVKAIGGLGTTIDVVLVNGHLRVGDTIVVAGQEGSIVTQVRGLLMPEPNKELRVRVCLSLG